MVHIFCHLEMLLIHCAILIMVKPFKDPRKLFQTQIMSQLLSARRRSPGSLNIYPDSVLYNGLHMTPSMISPFYQAFWYLLARKAMSNATCSGANLVALWKSAWPRTCQTGSRRHFEHLKPRLNMSKSNTNARFLQLMQALSVVFIWKMSYYGF